MAANRPACARLLAVAPAGRSAASYTITRDTTAPDEPEPVGIGSQTPPTAGRKAEDAGLENDATRPLLVARLRAESNGVILPVLR
jgi:hypothetical protein